MPPRRISTLQEAPTPRGSFPWPSVGSGARFLLLSLVVLAFFSSTCRAQRPYPLTGSDAPLPVDTTTGKVRPVDVLTTVLLERVLDLDEKANGYSAIWWVILTWSDADAGPTVAASTAAAMQPNGSCNRFCDSAGLAAAGCCDGIWMPHIELPNLVSYDDDQMPRYRVNVNASSGNVTWSTRLVGKWYAPLDYRAYPFDHQHVLLELAIADWQSPVAALKWVHVAQLNNTAHTKGPDVSGWRIKWSKGKVYDSRACYRDYNIAAPRYVPPNDPPSSANGSLPDSGNGANAIAGASALAPAAAGDGAGAVYESVTLSNRYLADNHAAGTTKPHDGCGPWRRRYDEALALYPPVVLVADIMVKRVSSYYVLTNLIPVLLITLVAFVVFFMPQNALGDRMSVVLTMFLSLTAMQFVFDFPPANYINALQMVVLVSYIMISLACIESLIVNRIATVSDVVQNKRSCVRKYSGMLSRSAFDRHLSRELFSKSSTGLHPAGSATGAFATGATAGGGVGSSGKVYVVGRGIMRTPVAVGKQAGVNGGLGVHGRGRLASGAAGRSADGVGCQREDSAIEGQHLLQAPPGSPAATATAPSPADAVLIPNSNLDLSPEGPVVTTAASTSSLHPARKSARVNFSPDNGATPSMHRVASAASGASGPGATATAGGAGGTPAGALAAAPKPTAGSTAGSVAGDATSTDDTVPELTATAGGTATAHPLSSPSAPPHASPFASARTHNTSFAATTHGGGGDDALPVYDARSVCSAGSRASTVVTVAAANMAAMARRCAALGCWRSLRAFFVAVGTWLAAVATAPANYYRQCKEDRAFAHFLAARIDKWSCIVSVVLYILCISLLLWMEVRVGDHKLMLGDRPGNM